MHIEDWQKWMDQHHIKLRGDPNDSGKDAGSIDGGISREHVATEGERNGRSSGGSDIQEHAGGRKTT